ncbi:MAG: thermonuclease family protein [Frankiaceae bacterium]
MVPRPRIARLVPGCLLALAIGLGLVHVPAPDGDRRSGISTVRTLRTGRVPMPSSAFRAYVLRTIDGDTVVARPAGSGRAVRVRLIGIDAPELARPGAPARCFADEARSRAAALLTHRWVLAAYEPGGRKDRYGRRLWDLWLTDGTFVAAALASGGWARALAVPPQTVHAPVLARLAAAARTAGRGAWSPACLGRAFPRARGP